MGLGAACLNPLRPMIGLRAPLGREPGRVEEGMLAAGLVLATASVVIAASGSYHGAVPARWLPVAAAAAETVPGLGHWVLGRPAEAEPWLCALAVPTTLAALGTPPLVNDAVRGYFVINPTRPILQPGPVSFFGTTAVKIGWVDQYLVYQQARDLTDNATFAHPQHDSSLQDILTAPFVLRNLLDWRIWAAMAAGLVVEHGLPALLDPQPLGPTVLQARTANFYGIPMTPAQGLALDLATVPIVAYQPAVGEESLFRGVVQQELEHDLGQWPGLLTLSALFGFMHMRPGVSNSEQETRFLVPALAEIILGSLYQATGYDITKPIAARFYFELGDFTWNALRPLGNQSVIGVKYGF